MKMKQPLQVLFLEFLLGAFLEGEELLHYTSHFPCSAISFTTILTLGLVNSHSVCQSTSSTSLHELGIRS